MGRLAPFIAVVPDITIEDGMVHFRIGGDDLCCATIATYRKGIARAVRVLAEHDARIAEVLPMRRRGGK